MSRLPRILIGALNKSGFDMSVQHYNNITQTGSNPAVATITLDTPVPVGESFAYITQKNNEFFSSSFAIAVLQTIVAGNYTECRIESIVAGGFNQRYSLQVVTSPNFSVQQVLTENLTGDNLPRNETISAVDRNKTFVVSSFSGGDDTRVGMMQTQLTSATVLQWRAEQTFGGSTYSLCCYVVEMDIGVVQYGTSTLSGLSIDVTNNEGAGNTFCIYTYRTNLTDDVCDDSAIRGRWVDNDTYRFERQVATGNVEISWFLITISNTSLQRKDATFSGTGGDRIDTISISTVDVSKSWNAVPNMCGNAMRDANHELRNCLISHELSSTEVTCRWRSPDTTVDTILSTQILSV